jgi:flavin reductase (DIM6/NTAB) family NADH-FMN oxidoreductase RutF/DNA-binding MarR family transcriptional regulator
MSAPVTDELRAFRNALGSFATGVTVVTTIAADGTKVGLTANSFNSVSLDPPMVLWSLARTSRALPIFTAAEFFAIHILSAEQEALSTLFARPGVDKFAGLSVDTGFGNVPLLQNCSARFQCRTAFQYEGGDHVIFVGKVEKFDHTIRAPLLFHGGQYALAVNKRRDEPAGEPEDPNSSFSQDFLIYLLGRAHHQLFLEIRRELEKRGLSEDQWFVMSLLGVSDHRTVAELDRLLAYTGRRVSYTLVAGLAAAEFVQLEGVYDPHARVTLTPNGRQVVIELVSAAKAIESDAECSLDPSEIHVLKRALRTIIRNTDPGLPLLLSSTDPE